MFDGHIFVIVVCVTPLLCPCYFVVCVHCMLWPFMIIVALSFVADHTSICRLCPLLGRGLSTVMLFCCLCPLLCPHVTLPFVPTTTGLLWPFTITVLSFAPTCLWSLPVVMSMHVVLSFVTTVVPTTVVTIHDCYFVVCDHCCDHIPLCCLWPLLYPLFLCCLCSLLCPLFTYIIIITSWVVIILCT